MVYTKEDGTMGFSWQKHYGFLLREHPEDLEQIVHSKLKVLAEQEPQQATYYQDMSTQLLAKLDRAADEAVENDKGFGHKESNAVTKEFIKEQHLTHLFEDVPLLCGEDEADSFLLDEDEEVDLSFLDEELEDIPWNL